MRILHTSDWHIGKFVNGYSMFEMQKAFLQSLPDLLEEQKIDVLVIAGDVFHRSVPSAECVSLISEVFYQIGVEKNIPIMVIAGNHDSRERLTYLNSFARHNNVYIEGFVKRQVEKISLCDAYGKVHFYLLPYVEPAFVRAVFEDEKVKTFDQAVEKATAQMLAQLDMQERNVLVGHGFFSCLGQGALAPQDLVFSQSEVSIGGSDLVDASRFAAFDYVAFGHLHAPQKVGSNTMRYSGSLMKYSVSEANQDKSMTVVELGEKGQIDIKLLPVRPLHDLRIIEGYFDKLCDRNRGQHEDLEDFVFANLVDREIVLDAITRLKAVYPNILGLRYQNRAVGDALLQGFSTSQTAETTELLFARFYKQAAELELNEFQQAVVRKTLAVLEQSED